MTSTNQPESGIRTPWLFQKRAIDFFRDRSGILADECGLGKTLTSIETVKVRREIGWRENHPTWIGPTLVICNNAAKSQWADEIRVQCPSDPVIILGKAGRVPTGQELAWYFFPDRKPAWVIVHYEALRFAHAQLSQFFWATVIADEAHRIKNRKTKQARSLDLINSAFRFPLTGTPIHKNPADLWGILHWVAPDRFRSYWDFFETFVEYKFNIYSGYREITGAKNVDRLVEVLQPIFLRRTKEEVLPDLPPKLFQTVHLLMGKHQAALYKQVAKEDDIEVQIAPNESILIPNTLARITRLQQILADPAMAPFNQHMGSVKLEWVRDYITDNPGVPMLVFSRFFEPVNVLAHEFEAALVAGKQRHAQSSRSIADFKAGRTNLLCGTIAALGESLDLGRASRAIFIDQDWSTRAMSQAYDRIHRATATEAKHIIKLIVPGTVDELVEESLQGNWSIQTLVYNAIARLKYDPKADYAGAGK